MSRIRAKLSNRENEIKTCSALVVLGSRKWPFAAWRCNDTGALPPCEYLDGVGVFEAADRKT
jgi:hypothetical protein